MIFKQYTFSLLLTVHGL